MGMPPRQDSKVGKKPYYTDEELHLLRAEIGAEVMGEVSKVWAEAYRRRRAAALLRKIREEMRDGAE